MTDPLGQSQVLPYLRGISKAGYNVHLVSYEKPDQLKKHRKVIDLFCKEASIKWHFQDYSSQGGLISTLKQIKRMKKITMYLHEKHNFDIVHCRSYISALAGLILKRKSEVKFVFDMRGFWADERVDGKLWDLNKPLFKLIYRFFKKKEIQFFKEADYTISLTENGKNEIESWTEFSAKKPRIKIIPCCVDLNLFDPSNITEQAKKNLKDELEIKPDNFVLGYVGSIGTWYMLDEMLDYFKVLKSKNNNAIFLFITGENELTIMEKVIQKGINPESVKIKSVLHKEVPLHISIFDNSVFFIRSTYSKKASSPTKQGEIMAMGIPLICNAGIGDTDSIVKKYNAGEIVTEFSDVSYLNIVSHQIKFDINETIRGAHEYFSLDEGIRRYLSIYSEIYE